MAITYLGGGIVEGILGTASPASDWTESGSKYTLTSNQVDFALKRDGSYHYAYADLGANASSTWVLRMHINFTGNSSGDGYAKESFWGLSSTTGNWGASQDSAGATMTWSGTGGSGDNRFTVIESDGSAIMDGSDGSRVNYTGHTVTPTGEWWVELKRINSTTITLGVYTDATYGTLVSGTSVTSNTAFSGTGLRYVKFALPNYASQGEIQNGTVNDIEFYDAMTTASGTPTKKFLSGAVDEKATITNIPIGTRYHETDTRKIFRMSTVPNVVIDFTGAEATASNWTHPSTDSGGNSGAHGFSVTTESSLTGSAGTIDITGRDWDSTIDMVTHCGLATAIPAQTKFVIDWDFYRHSDDTSDHPVFAFSSEAHGVDPRGGNSSKEVVWACEQNNQDDSPYDGQNSVKLYCKNSSGTSYGNTITVSGDSTSLQSKGETRYWRCIYGETASTYLSVRLQRYDTAVNRTAGGSTGRELNLVSGGWASATAQTAWEAGDPIRYFTLLTYNNGQKAFSIDNITWYDDSLTAVAKVPSWVEKGTA